MEKFLEVADTHHIRIAFAHADAAPAVSRPWGKGPKLSRKEREQRASRARPRDCNNSGCPPSLVVKESDRRRTLPSVLVEESAIAIPDELERAYRAHHGLVFRTAYRITGNAADAEDVLQTVFLRLVRRGENADAVENQESYLRRAAINAALDVIRSRQATPTVELLDSPVAIAQNDAGGLRRALARALAQLKPRQAEIFALRFLEGFSNPQIARMLGISQVLVAVIVHRTRQQLRKELRPYLL
jgi:RNA polymerase sigma-70 factor, ECF subfamily